jgi:hypothetical protein
MVVATATAQTSTSPASRSLSRRLRRLRLDELLACAGAGTALFWPGDAGSSTQLIIVAVCFVPVGVRTLLHLEASLVVPPPAAFHTELGHPDYRTAFQHTRTALALLDAGHDGLVVRHANPAFDLLCPGGFHPAALFTAADAAAITSAVTEILGGRSATWDTPAILRGTGEQDDAAWVQIGLTRLPRGHGGEATRISLSMVRIAPPAGSAAGL